jgi:small multidrug resistance family-3 protein
MVKYLVVFACLLVATTLESFGDATVRIGLYNRTGITQAAVLIGGAVLLFGYGVMINVAPLPFERIVGLYIATLFCVWQTVAYVTFQKIPNLPILAGGALIVAGGLIVTFWRQQPA